MIDHEADEGDRQTQHQPLADIGGKTGIISTYMSHGVFRGIRRGRIISAPADAPVIQGKLGIEMAVRALEGKLSVTHAGPAIQTVTSQTADRFDRAANLAPASFLPTFSLESGRD
ncbi:hypothetical protein [Paracoccus shanxieyensis]|uniref:Uncharacterized protein n=1 Tax=Paracoccus shanxieyensis TaxID=2675752 RepID=A0A6L6IYB1_9RHOB|nr:hypothetical protein [Paracoccus shanxieyensis]MTH64060.1 hypothetical protein [Paracoccus shanxieyensis]MTH86899.1 hypothetical protein [Paracoccus shanxieyensis]